MDRHELLRTKLAGAFATILIAAGFSGCGLLHRHREPPAAFLVTDLSPLPGGKTSQVMAVNDARAWVGRADFGGSRGHQHAVIWENGAPPRDLGTLDGGGSEADAISPGGRIVGWSSYAKANVHACEFSGSTPRDLGVDDTMSFAVGVGDDGRIVISRSIDSGAVHTFVLDGSGKAVDVGVLPGYRDMTGASMAPNGTIVGVADNGLGAKRAFEWSNGTLSALPPIAGDTNSYANFVSPLGVVAGSCSQGPGHFTAVIWNGGSPTALSTPQNKDSEAFAVADSGDVVGECNNHACLWHKGVLMDLNGKIGRHAKTVLNAAVAIDSAGRIAVNGIVNNQIHAFLLTPASRVR